MRTSTSLIALSAPLFASAAPLFARTASANDILVFQFAHVLEQLETQFYQAAIAKFQVADFIAAGYSSAEVAVEQLQSIVADESAHTTALEAAIKSFGAEPISSCVFNFDSVLTDVATTMTVARVVELTGVGAYLGAAGLLDDPRFLTSAASILTIEARHSSILNALNGGTAIPQAFDIPLAPNQVLAIAGAFISGCNEEIGITGNAPLAITNTGTVAAGTLLTFQSDAITNWNPDCPLFCNMIVGGATDALIFPIEQCVVPANVFGPVAIIVTSDAQPLLASQIVDQNQNTTVAGPTIAFIDFGLPEQTLSQLILTPGSKLTKDLNGAAPISSDSTSTITNEQATSVAAAGSAAATADASSSSSDITPVMPAAADPVVVGSAGLPIAATTDSASIALPSSGVADVPVSGAGSSSPDVIIPLMPAASAPAAAPSGAVNVAVLGFDA